MSANNLFPSLKVSIFFVILMAVITGLSADFILYELLSYERIFSKLQMIGIGAFFTVCFTSIFYIYKRALSHFIDLDSFRNLVLTVVLNSLVMGLTFLFIILSLNEVIPSVELSFSSNKVKFLFLVSFVAYTLGALFFYSFEFYKKYNLAQSKHIESLKSALDAQVKPHFLFNALNNIASLIEINEGRAQKAILKLADLYRSILKLSEEKYITIEKELEFIEEYLSIIRLQYDQNIQHSFDIDRRLKTFKIPPLLIQPLIENCIKHGYKNLSDAFKIELNIHQIEDYLIIQVKDSGPGFKSVEQISELDNIGTGLANIERKLTLHYPERAKIWFEQQSTYIRIPYSQTN